jgi:hypothetical protein
VTSVDAKCVLLARGQLGSTFFGALRVFEGGNGDLCPKKHIIARGKKHIIARGLVKTALDCRFDGLN